MKYVVLIALLTFTPTLFSQKKPDTLKVDYKKTTNTIEEIDKDFSKSKNGINVQVNGINTNLHKVVVKFKDFTWLSENPASLAKVLPGVEKYIIPKTKSNIGSQPEKITYKFDPSKVKPALSRNQDSNLYEIINVINNAKKMLVDKYVNNQSDLDSIFLSMSIDTIAYYLNINTQKRKELTGTKLMYTLVKKVDSLQFTYKIELDNISNDGLSKKTKLTLPELVVINEKYKKLIKIKPALLAGVSTIIKGTLINNKGQFTSKKHSIKKEATTMQIFIMDRFNPKDTIATYKQDIYKTKKIKLDFSVGIGANTLIDPTFYIGKEDSIPIISTEQNEQIDIALFSLLHFNCKLTSSFSIGPLIGVSISLTDAKPSYLLGGGLTFGKEKTISISGGASFGQLKLLSHSISSDGYNVDKSLDPGIEEVPTYKKMCQGYFLALTYNFGRVKK